MVQHGAQRVVCYNLRSPSGWLQLIGATFRNATLSFVVSSHQDGNDLRDLADNCNGRDGGEGDCGDGASDDNCQWSQCWLGTGTDWRVLKNRRGGSCLHVDL